VPPTPLPHISAPDLEHLHAQSQLLTSLLLLILLCFFHQEFQANDDLNSMVINRFHQPVIAQIIRLEFVFWNAEGVALCCARMEVFACSDTGWFVWS
jgi:hypothetical protein